MESLIVVLCFMPRSAFELFLPSWSIFFRICPGAALFGYRTVHNFQKHNFYKYPADVGKRGTFIVFINKSYKRTKFKLFDENLFNK